MQLIDARTYKERTLQRLLGPLGLATQEIQGSRGVREALELPKTLWERLKVGRECPTANIAPLKPHQIHPGAQGAPNLPVRGPLMALKMVFLAPLHLLFPLQRQISGR